VCACVLGGLARTVWSHLASVALLFSGVTNIQTDVPTKKVLVTADDSVSPQDMLEKLLKVSFWRSTIFGCDPPIDCVSKTMPDSPLMCVLCCF
jgi:hypothetical protein